MFTPTDNHTFSFNQKSIPEQRRMQRPMSAQVAENKGKLSVLPDKVNDSKPLMPRQHLEEEAERT